jgi:hypothetical protein
MTRMLSCFPGSKPRRAPVSGGEFLPVARIRRLGTGTALPALGEEGIPAAFARLHPGLGQRYELIHFAKQNLDSVAGLGVADAMEKLAAMYDLLR